MGEVRFDFQRVRQQEQRLDEIAAKLAQTISDSYSDAMQELKLGWQSDGSTKFAEKEQILAEKMQATVTLIRQTRNALGRAHSKAIYIEEKAKEIAKNRGVNK